MHEKHHSLRTRLTAPLLALICVLGLFPTTAFAASDTITLKEFGHSGVAYQAAAVGHDVRKTLVGKLDDPDAYGAERIAVYGMNYDEQTLADFAAAKAGSVTVPFQATSFEYLDKVDPPQ